MKKITKSLLIAMATTSIGLSELVPSGNFAITGNASVSGINSCPFLPSGKFTIEYWIYPESQNFKSNVGFIQGAADHRTLDLCYTNQGSCTSRMIAFRAFFPGTPYEMVLKRYDTLSTKKWHHVACIADTKSGAIYFDGVKILSKNDTTGIVCGDRTKFYIETSGCKVDNIRISKSVRYTTDFTPQTSFVKDSLTALLFQFESKYDSSKVYDDTKTIQVNQSFTFTQKPATAILSGRSPVKRKSSISTLQLKIGGKNGLYLANDRNKSYYSITGKRYKNTSLAF